MVCSGQAFVDRPSQRKPVGPVRNFFRKYGDRLLFSGIILGISAAAMFVSLADKSKPSYKYEVSMPLRINQRVNLGIESFIVVNMSARNVTILSLPNREGTALQKEILLNGSGVIGDAKVTADTSTGTVRICVGSCL